MYSTSLLMNKSFEQYDKCSKCSIHTCLHLGIANVTAGKETMVTRRLKFIVVILVYDRVSQPTRTRIICFARSVAEVLPEPIIPIILQLCLPAVTFNWGVLLTPVKVREDDSHARQFTQLVDHVKCSACARGVSPARYIVAPNDETPGLWVARLLGHING